jgi:hypothetical protein
MDSVTEVVVVGAGPTGLMLAPATLPEPASAARYWSAVPRRPTSPAPSPCTPERWSCSTRGDSPTTWWPPASGLVHYGCSASSRWTSPGYPPDSLMCW